MRPLFFALVGLAFVTASSANAHVLDRPKPIRSMTLEEKERFQVGALAHASGAIRFLRAVSGPLSPSARRELVFHRAMRRWTLRELSETRSALYRARHPADFAGAVRLVERFYGPQPFLRSCPSSEGGFGVWVWNGGYPITDWPTDSHGSGRPSGSSGAGGWLQFMHSTFESVIDRAVADAHARGMVFSDVAVKTWTSPLGQALAGVRMLADGRRGEWSGRTC